jgi:NhaP-type Na+/H+ or K+/H+ antiporter
VRVTVTQWFVLLGGLMLARGMASTLISRSPFTSPIVYLGIGLALGPNLLDLLDLHSFQHSALLEVLTEVAVLISLFSAGIKMPVPFTFARWDAPIRLAWLAMAITVGLIAAFCHWALGMPLGAAILLGGMLAPTDPVLATDVQVRSAGDNDPLRFTLTCEAGLNDGSAFPFVMLGLGLMGADAASPGLFQLFHWIWHDMIWATAIAIVVGVVAGAGLARVGWFLRTGNLKHEVLDDLVGLGLIGVTYGIANVLGGWGFLAVFVAGVALRQTELLLAGAPRDGEGLLEPDTAKSAAAQAADTDEAPLTVSDGTLVFKEHLERLSELLLVILLGTMLPFSSWRWQSVLIALFLFFVARPVSVFLSLAGSGTGMRTRAMVGWFGVRGIGSIYYLMFALQHGLGSGIAVDIARAVLVTIVLSICIHGLSVKPLMNWFDNRQRRR